MQNAIQNAMRIFRTERNIIVLLEVLHMAFQLKPNKKETENKTIRFPVSLIENIEEVIGGQDVTFSSFVIQACEYALENMETGKEGNRKNSS
jgi:hypothetical protein